VFRPRVISPCVLVLLHKRHVPRPRHGADHHDIPFSTRRYPSIVAPFWEQHLLFCDSQPWRAIQQHRVTPRLATCSNAYLQGGSSLVARNVIGGAGSHPGLFRVHRALQRLRWDVSGDSGTDSRPTSSSPANSVTWARMFCCGSEGRSRNGSSTRDRLPRLHHDIPPRSRPTAADLHVYVVGSAASADVDRHRNPATVRIGSRESRRFEVGRLGVPMTTPSICPRIMRLLAASGKRLSSAAHRMGEEPTSPPPSRKGRGELRQRHQTSAANRERVESPAHS